VDGRNFNNPTARQLYEEQNRARKAIARLQGKPWRIYVLSPSVSQFEKWYARNLDLCHNCVGGSPQYVSEARQLQDRPHYLRNVHISDLTEPDLRQFLIGYCMTRLNGLPMAA